MGEIPKDVSDRAIQNGEMALQLLGQMSHNGSEIVMSLLFALGQMASMKGDKPRPDEEFEACISDLCTDLRNTAKQMHKHYSGQCSCEHHSSSRLH